MSNLFATFSCASSIVVEGEGWALSGKMRLMMKFPSDYSMLSLELNCIVLQKAFLDKKCREAQNKQGLPVLPEERSCACNGGWKSTGDQHIAELA
jgi:hypothetical protein